MRTWLQLSGFSVERQLTVSHLRIGWMKRHLPLKLLVWLDSLFSLTGDLWQLTPSVFVRSSAVGQTPVAEPGAFFRCPACGAGPLADTPPELHCEACGQTYPVENGIYDFRLKYSEPVSQPRPAQSVPVESDESDE